MRGIVLAVAIAALVPVGAASVRVDAAQWVDYLHLGKWNGQWKIVTVLWEMRPSS